MPDGGGYIWAGEQQPGAMGMCLQCETLLCFDDKMVLQVAGPERIPDAGPALKRLGHLFANPNSLAKKPDPDDGSVRSIN
jgi:hypothetical protein